MKLYGRVDVMLNNAGYMPHSNLEDGDVGGWVKMIDINIKGVLYGIHAALPQMKMQKSGQIINTSSIGGLNVWPGTSVYCATIWAVRAFTEGLHQEVKPYNLRTTTIYPGAVESELSSHIPDPEIQKMIDSLNPVPAKTFADMIVFAISQPENVDVNDIVFRPTSQAM